MNKLAPSPIQEDIANMYLGASDYDNTVALTSEPAPNGMTVEASCEEAILTMFGSQALEQYIALGGLRNRAPIEIVAELCPDFDNEAIQGATDDFVQQKLSHTLPQVGCRLDDGTLWPRPTVGFRDTWLALSACPIIDTAVITSGHRTFINKFFDVQGLEPPDDIIAEEDVRPLMQHLPVPLCVKPSRMLMDIAHHRWRERHAMGISLSDSLDRVVYAGDDPVKDGQLADAANVAFVHINPGYTEAGWRQFGSLLMPSLVEVRYVES